MSTKKAAVVMQTDFTKDISVCTMQGVCMMVDPELRVFDNTHEIKNFDTYQASTALSYVVDFASSIVVVLPPIMALPMACDKIGRASCRERVCQYV